ncbi:MAG: heme ABC exporter ATP-binding protein CcmA [Hyphomicrobiaceae bacterium]
MRLILENVTICRGERTILEGFSLEVAGGETILLTGRNGAGKTTLLRAIAGVLPVADGKIALDPGGGEAAAGAEVAEQCHFVGHLNGIKGQLSVAENARFWTDFLGGDRNGVLEALRQFRLAELSAIRAGYLSAGQKRRLGLVRVMLARRPLWLLDEPAVSLDTASQHILAEAIERHQAGGGITIAATHQPLGVGSTREVQLGAGRIGS